MNEYPIPHLAEKFMALFKGNTSVYGVSTLTGTVGSDGKHEAQSWLKHEPTTSKIWEAHLLGRQSIGQVPITVEGTIKWAAFDVDEYKDLGVKDMLGLILTHNLPIILCRSKSGGAHGYVFFKEPVQAAAVRIKLQEFATFFGQGGCEIFPKQDKLGTSNNGDVMYGNWLNMPYDGPMSLRYALNEHEQALTSHEFVDFAESRQVTEKEFLGFKLPRNEVVDMEDGPPCLNHLWSEKTHMKGGRNTLLFNTAVYLKKRFPDATKEETRVKLATWNVKLKEPLAEKELEATVLKSTKNREYQYQCGNPVLKNHCNSHVCCNCLYGIDGDENAFDPNNKTLIQLLTEPPLFFIDYKQTQLTISKEELWSYDKVRQACMVQSRHIPPKMDQEHWLNLVNGYLQSCTVIDIPPEATPVGQLTELLQHWKKSAAEDPKLLINRQPVTNKAKELIFRIADLKSMLKTHQFTALPMNKLVEALRTDLQAESRQTTIDGKSVRVWIISDKKLTVAEEININTIQQEKENF
tara:strand:+ start:7147 stop:8712 length:1566 start_codon:yes stop_codon:yes gene_type:complete